MFTEERGVTKGKGGYADQWHHDVTDEHGNPKHSPGTKKHHEGRAEEHKWLSRDANHIDHYNYVPKEKHHIIAVADAHKKAAEAHEKVLTLKGKQLHPDHPHVHAAMKATENVHKAQKAQKDYHNSSEYKALEKKRQAKRDKEHEEMKYAASISTHKRNLAHAKDPSIRRHDEAKRQLADFHATRKALKDPKHPDHKEAQHKARVFPYKYGDHLAKIKEDLDSDPQSMDNRRLGAIARNPNHPMHTHAKAELERRRMKTSEGAMKRIATTQASKTDRMASTDKKGLETFKKKPATEAYKEPQGQAKRIMSPLQKARMDKEKADRDADGKLKEKTLTPAELKKREKIAKAIERDNPDMPMDKKMAIATATAKRVAEGAYLKGSIESRADAHEDQADHHERQAEKAHKDGDRLAASTHKAAARAHMKAASYYDNYLSKPKHLRPQAASGGASQAAHAATQKANQYNESIAESKDDDYHKTLSQTKNSYEGIAALKKKHGMSHTKAVATLRRLMKDSKPEKKLKDTSGRKADRSWGKSSAFDYHEEVELGEGNMTSAAKELEAYARKSGGIDKNDFMKAVMLMKRNQSKQLNKFVDELDTEPREKILSVMQKHIKETTGSTIKELDKKTLGSYIKKAVPDREKQKAQAARHSDAGDMADKDRDMYKHYGNAQRAMDKAANRSKYIGKAVDKLTKEATIPDGQTAMTRVAKVSDADREKLIKIRKMLDKEKKK